MNGIASTLSECLEVCLLIQPTLVLDHYYFSMDENEFADLREIFSQFSSAFHEVVKSDGDQWEGLYIYTRGQHYLEFLNERRPGGIGICQKPFSPLTQDARKIMEDLPHLPWKKFDRLIDGQLWFSAMSCDDYLNPDTLFNTWVTHYAQRTRSGSFKIWKYPIERVTEISVLANPSLKELILKNSEWFNAVRDVADESIAFQFQTYYSDPFLYSIHFDAGIDKFKFRSLEMLTVDGFELQPISRPTFQMDIRGNKIKLTRV